MCNPAYRKTETSYQGTKKHEDYIEQIKIKHFSIFQEEIDKTKEKP